MLLKNNDVCIWIVNIGAGYTAAITHTHTHTELGSRFEAHVMLPWLLVFGKAAFTSSCQLLLRSDWNSVNELKCSPCFSENQLWISENNRSSSVRLYSCDCWPVSSGAPYRSLKEEHASPGCCVQILGPAGHSGSPAARANSAIKDLTFWAESTPIFTPLYVLAHFRFLYTSFLTVP